MVQYVPLCCSVSKCVAVRSSVFAVHCSALQRAAVRCSALQCAIVCHSVYDSDSCARHDSH